MLVLPDYGKPYLLYSLTAPVVIKHHWIFHAPSVDFMLSPITYLEETTGGALLVRINGSEFWVPSSWNILVTDRETYQLDTVSIQSCASVSHTAFGFSIDETQLRTFDIQIIDATENMALVHPMIAKGTAYAHPVGPITIRSYQETHASVVIGPHDLYKHLAGKVVGDVFSW